MQPISCDEAFVDITGLGSPDRIVAELRAEIQGATGVTASAGIGPNMLLARLATKRAKPDGQFNINPSQARPCAVLSWSPSRLGLPLASPSPPVH